jgi:hypothetical protein
MYFVYLTMVYNIFKLCNCFALSLMLFILLILLNKKAKKSTYYGVFKYISACIFRAFLELQVHCPTDEH